MAAPGEDRPIVVSGGDEMYTVTLPPDTTPVGGSFVVNALPQDGPFKTIEVINNETGKPVFSTSAMGNWTITIQ
jgi:hypothetical protein